jgi:predicted GIY-YIG superfamily endonuclease
MTIILLQVDRWQGLCKFMQMNWIVYILKCADDTLYTGITNDLTQRIAKHESGAGAKYTRGRDPYIVIYTEPHETRSAATKREAEIKSLTRAEKLELAGFV